MGKRSRGGCHECKRSHIKCDETRPLCGTCARRSRLCPGYATSSDDTLGIASTLETGMLRQYLDRDRDMVPLHSASGPAAPQPLQYPLALIPELAHMDDRDWTALRCYFQQHVQRISLGAEFVADGNGRVMALLQQYPATLGDILLAIGHTHAARVDREAVVPALTRKSRALAQLRGGQAAHRDLEPKLLLALGIGALELIDTADIPQTSSSIIPALLAYAASILTAHLAATPPPLGDMAKYFVRALTRQDLLFALTYRRRNLIPTRLWFDAACAGEVDRFLGLTMSLMPLLEELCGLAEDMKVSAADCDSRAESLGRRISLWHPPIESRGLDVSFARMRKYLMQAQSFRGAALLYLHRLRQPAGASPAADALATSLAYDVLLYCHGDHADVRMLLWPLFVAGCEMQAPADRQLVLALIHANYRARGTYTALQAARFLAERLWPAADADGGRCRWMDLIETFSAHFAPL